MNSDNNELQDAINRALKSANRALKIKAFDKVADIYFRIAYMMNEVGDEAAAENFATAAKRYKEKNNIMREINVTMGIADAAYEKRDYASVAENYLKISSLAEIFGDKATANKFKDEASKFLSMVTIQLKPEKPKIPEKQQLKSMVAVSSDIQAQIPSTIEIKQDAAHFKPTQQKPVKIDDALVALGLVCPACGKDVSPDLAKCPNCNQPI